MEDFYEEMERDCHIGEKGFINGIPVEDMDFSQDEMLNEVLGRTFRDTQIYKEGAEPTSEEWKIITEKLLVKDGYKFYNDTANGFFAISFSEVWQKENESWGMNLVDKLNSLYDNSSPWNLGDENEEYVFVN